MIFLYFSFLNFKLNIEHFLKWIYSTTILSVRPSVRVFCPIRSCVRASISSRSSFNPSVHHFTGPSFPRSLPLINSFPCSVDRSIAPSFTVLFIRVLDWSLSETYLSLVMQLDSVIWKRNETEKLTKHESDRPIETNTEKWCDVESLDGQESIPLNKYFLWLFHY